jgi:hypothetical protein
MPRGDKSKYTAKQKRKARDIEQSYEARGLDEREAEARAWATVNKQSGGGDRPGGSGRTTSPAQKAAARRDSAPRACHHARPYAEPRAADFAPPAPSHPLAALRPALPRGRDGLSAVPGFWPRTPS